jgi:hypothetical protein
LYIRKEFCIRPLIALSLLELSTFDFFFVDDIAFFGVATAFLVCFVLFNSIKIQFKILLHKNKKYNLID